MTAEELIAYAPRHAVPDVAGFVLRAEHRRDADAELVRDRPSAADPTS